MRQTAVLLTAFGWWFHGLLKATDRHPAPGAPVALTQDRGGSGEAAERVISSNDVASSTLRRFETAAPIGLFGSLFRPLKRACEEIMHSNPRLARLLRN